MVMYDLIVCILLFTVVGIIDDIVHLKPMKKLSLQVLAGSIYVFIFSIPLVEGVWMTLWFIIIVNAFNFIDGMDGLAISYASVIFIWSLSVHGSDLVTLTLLGASLGFLPFNICNARSYLGDSGSHALGSAIGYLTIPSMGSAYEVADFTVVTLLLADIGFVAVSRGVRGVSILTGNTDHLAHRLARAVGASRVLPIFSVSTILIVTASIYIRNASMIVQGSFLFFVWLTTSVLVILLERRTRHFFI
jgi:UDP-GlcNAc:undecaprenyl-phosphate/decaprenyl-phosphate GlcNAc-1-phosphate transferase